MQESCSMLDLNFQLIEELVEAALNVKKGLRKTNKNLVHNQCGMAYYIATLQYAMAQGLNFVVFFQFIHSW